jgi:anti-repressor protein
MSCTDILPFTFEGADVRTISRDGEPWFVLADVCRVLEHSNASVAASRLDEDEKGVSTVYTLGGDQSVVVINESGLYSLVLTSRKPQAKRFKKWITAEVIPAIRKTGGYMIARPDETPEELALRALQVLQATVERQKAQLVEQAPKVSFYDRYANADGLYGLQNAGRALGLGPNKFIQKLKQGYLFYQGGNLIAKAVYVSQGLFEMKSSLDDQGKTRFQAYVTPKGIQYLASKFGPDLLGEARH